MTAMNVAAWIPETQGSVVLNRIENASVAETLFRREPMTTNARSVPRTGSVDIETVPKSQDYGEDASTEDDVTLTAKKFGKLFRLADEDMGDTEAVGIQVMDTKKKSWAIAYAKHIDNATLGTTAASNGTTVPFTSAYRALRTSDAVTGYVADDNYLNTGGNLEYSDLSDVFGQVEDSDWYDEMNMNVVASPAFKKLVRNIEDSHGDPVFKELAQWPTGGTGPTLFGHPLKWSIGAKTSPTATSRPTGNPLLFFGNFDYAILGVRSGPESKVSGPDGAFTSDESMMKIRARRGFAIGFPQAFAVLEASGYSS